MKILRKSLQSYILNEDKFDSKYFNIIRNDAGNYLALHKDESKAHKRTLLNGETSIDPFCWAGRKSTLIDALSYIEQFPALVEQPFLDKEIAKNFGLRAYDVAQMKDYENKRKSITENLSYYFTTSEDVISGMLDNASDADIDSNIKLFNKINKYLKTKNCIIYIDPEGEYNPDYYDEYIIRGNISNSFNDYHFSDIDFVSEDFNGVTYLYFKNESEASKYLSFIDKLNNE